MRRVSVVLSQLFGAILATAVPVSAGICVDQDPASSVEVADAMASARPFVPARRPLAAKPAVHRDGAFKHFSFQFEASSRPAMMSVDVQSLNAIYNAEQDVYDLLEEWQKATGTDAWFADPSGQKAHILGAPGYRSTDSIVDGYYRSTASFSRSSRPFAAMVGYELSRSVTLTGGFERGRTSVLAAEGHADFLAVDARRMVYDDYFGPLFMYTLSRRADIAAIHHEVRVDTVRLGAKVSVASSRSWSLRLAVSAGLPITRESMHRTNDEGIYLAFDPSTPITGASRQTTNSFANSYGHRSYGWEFMLGVEVERRLAKHLGLTASVSTRAEHLGEASEQTGTWGFYNPTMQDSPVRLAAGFVVRP